MIGQTKTQDNQNLLDSMQSLTNQRRFKQLLELTQITDSTFFSAEQLPPYFYFCGEGYRRDQRIDSALMYFKRCAILSKKQSNMIWQTKALDKMGSIYRGIGQNYIAIEVYLQSLKLKDGIHNNQTQFYEIGLSHEYLGLSYSHISKDSIAVDHHLEARRYYQKSDNRNRINGITNNIGLAYFNWAKEIRTKPFLFNQTQRIKRKELLQKSLDNLNILKAAKLDNVRLSRLYQNLSATFSEIGQQDSVYYYANKAKKLRLANSDEKTEIASTYNSLGYYFHETQKPDSAFYYYQLAFNGIKKKEGDQNDLLLTIYSNLSKYHKENDQHDSAYYYLLDYFELSRQTINEKGNARDQELYALYQAEQKEKDLVQERAKTDESNHQRSNMRTILIISLLLTTIIIGFLIQRSSISKIETKNLALAHNQEVDRLLQQQDLKTFDALIEGQEKERKRVAEELHDRLGSVLSAAKMHLEGGFHAGFKPEQFDYVNNLLNKAIDDTRQISHNMLSGVLTKFGLVAALHNLKETVSSADHLKVSLQTLRFDERLETEKELHLYRIVQELLSNALRHAEANQFDIKLSKEDKKLTLTVSDNGKGGADHAEKTGIGFKNIASRVKKIGADWTLSSPIGKGTLATVTLTI